MEPLFFYLQQLGLTVNQVAMTDYTQDYIPNNRDASGMYVGLGYHSEGDVRDLATTTNFAVQPAAARLRET